MPLPAKNLLGNETSPYLLQHQDNPVHWRPWSSDALREAREFGKPILLSVGYAACHWCHVMAHESFDNPQIADAMNRYFVNIKVDREERPEIDQIYMASLSAIGEQGGWPLTMFLDSEAQPFWGGTYFPPKQAYGRPGFLQVLEAVNEAWQNKRHELLKSAGALSAHVKMQLSANPGEAPSPLSALQSLATNIHAMIDRDLGGLRGAPKFPNAPFMRVLWLSGDSDHKSAVIDSLSAMLSGGIYDHVGGGLARYSTDDKWLIPHFEKMLYDNAQLLRLLCWVYTDTQNELFRIRIEETVAWLLREMRVEGGAFASSLDADTEGVEGKTYLWTEAQIRDALGTQADSFFQTFSLSKPDQWEGDPILHRRSHPSYLGEEREALLRSMLDELLATRLARAQPGRDDKVLLDWNGLAISALADAARLLDRPDWLRAARDAFRFACESMKDGRLPHSIRETRSVFPGLSSDYACMISAAASLFQSTSDQTFLDQAQEWADQLRTWYLDESGTGHYLTASDAKDVPIRIRGDIDEAIPSATSQVIDALLALSVLSPEPTNSHLSDLVQSALGRTTNQAYGQAGIIYASALAAAHKLLIMVEPGRQDVFVPVANRNLDPSRFDIVVGEKRTRKLPDGMSINPNERAAYLCMGQTCLPAIYTPEELEAALRRTQPVGPAW
ncbi:thioredoxin domain-containing protein [Nitratireductor kimnyeongensis]|uniref:Thioredoxin domain-containing protein n=1 Tax=Nitratireductor kimnyeongensis TaxID=430679 RepID=A0ABW0TC19_9HYPH|nr:thioredoxin domain-containing protein [Nitratireductor kimnyeongensis]QZZ37071.1 thioredoxin domain-containing protein [Nitratireductor kimnyeongensis]